MKKLLAAALAAFMIDSLAACAKAPAQPEPQPEASAAEPAQPSAQTEPAPESSDDNVIHMMGIECWWDCVFIYVLI